jgi:hypothetical protein
MCGSSSCPDLRASDACWRPSRPHTLVTFNGKSIDVPFMEMRWLYQRLETPLPALRHLGLLHPARRLWGPETGGLGGLEDRVLGFRRDDDVAGFEIPARYFEYLRPGDARPLRGVIAHNQLDLVSLGVLTGMACDVVDRGPQAAGSGRQSLCLGRLYERGGREADAPGCYERAVTLTSGARETMECDALAFAPRRSTGLHWRAGGSTVIATPRDTGRRCSNSGDVPLECSNARRSGHWRCTTSID